MSIVHCLSNLRYNKRKLLVLEIHQFSVKTETLSFAPKERYVCRTAIKLIPVLQMKINK